MNCKQNETGVPRPGVHAAISSEFGMIGPLLGPDLRQLIRDKQWDVLRAAMTAREALEHIRSTGRGKETLNILYVLDSNGKLLKELRLGTLVLAAPDAIIANIEDRPLVSIPATMDREQVLRAFE